MHLFTDPSLCIPSMAQVHADLIPHLDTIAEMAKWAVNGGVDWDGIAASPVSHMDAASIFRIHGPGVYSAPVLSREFCAGLVSEFNTAQYAVNEHEEVPFQIPELVLRHEALALFSALTVHFERILKPMAGMMFNMEPERVKSIQLAKYKPTEVGYGNWHLDFDSDFTAVVALSDDHTGGGTEVKPAGFGAPFEVPQLPVGHAMLFCGKTTLHRGMPVLEGVRNLLVFWSEIK